MSYFANALASTSQNIVYDYMTKTSTNTSFTFKLGNIFTNPAQRRVVRIVLCWSVDPTFSDYNNKHGTDLDISVYKRIRELWGYTYQYVGGSYSKDNNYEIYEFSTTSNSDYYRIIINKTRYDDIALNGIPFSIVFSDVPVGN